MLDNERAARQKKISKAIMWAVLLILFLCFIFPFVLVVINVFKTKADITTNPLAIIGAHGFTLKNFPEAMKKMNFGRVFMNSAIITGNKLVTSTPPGADPFYGAPCMLIVLVKESPNAMYDGPIVMQTLMLAAQSLGVNSIWIHRAKEEFESEEGKEILRQLGIEGDYIGIGHVALGYADSELPAPKPRKADYIHWAK